MGPVCELGRSSSLREVSDAIVGPHPKDITHPSSPPKAPASRNHQQVSLGRRFSMHKLGGADPIAEVKPSFPSLGPTPSRAS